MRVPTKDRIATMLVVLAVAVYLPWAAGAALPGMESVRVTGLVVLALGFVASAGAVVPGFDRLIHGNKLYLAATSTIGLVALAGGVVVLVEASEMALGVVMGAMVVLWAISTVHHMVPTSTGPTSHPEERPAAAGGRPLVHH
jgi:uncharacterized membrane protein YkgB